MSMPEFREQLKLVINTAAARTKGFNALEKEMKKFLAPLKLPYLKRRQLAKLGVEDIDLPLSLRQLEGLDYYLRHFCRTSLGHLWGDRNILQTLAADERIMFLLGSQPDREARRIDLSRWDIRAMREVLDGLYGLGMPLTIEFEDVIYRDAHADDFGTDKVARNEQWYHDLVKGSGAAVVCIGSPKANHGAEVLLSRMMGVEPFKPWSSSQPRPFAFIWSGDDKRGKKIQSCFKLDPVKDAQQVLALKGATPEIVAELQKSKDGSTLGIAVGDELFTVRRNHTSWDSYAVIAARRSGRRTEVCLAGLTGPATLGAAKTLREFKPHLDRSLDALVDDKPAGKSPTTVHRAGMLPRMAWLLVKTPVADDKQPTFRSDERRAGDSSIVGDVNYFDPAPLN
jgi:hypothetical protein